LSPEELHAEISKHAERSAKLREAHLDAVRDRAARESARAKEAVARKLRLHAARAEKIQRKMDAAACKVEAKREADEAEREAAKERREHLALSVAEARKAANELRAQRQAELREAEVVAYTKHTKAVSDKVAKGKMAVQHALAVVQAQKEKVATDAATKGEVLAQRLDAAEARRTTMTAADATPATPPLHRVRNDGKVLAETRRVALEASMAKASALRAAHLANVQGKAQSENAKAADVVAKVKAAATGTDEATCASRAAIYERLLNAEVARLSATKAKYDKKAAAKVEPVIVIRLDDVLTPRAPKPALIERLAARGTSRAWRVRC